MLVRNKPFKEWVTVYFDPKKTSEKKLLKLLRERLCPRSELDRGEDKVLTAMNPFVGPGGIVQLRLASPKHKKSYSFSLPEGWQVTGNKEGVSHEDRDEDDGAYYSVRVPANAKAGKHDIKVALPSGQTETITVEIVRRITH